MSALAPSTHTATSPVGRLLAAACLLVTGMAAVVATVLMPATGDPDVGAMNTYAAHLGRVDGGVAAETLLVLLGPAVVVAALLARPRAPRLAGVAAWLGMVSGSAWIALIGLDNAVRAAVPTDRAASAALLNKILGSVQFGVFVALALLGGLVTMVCLGIALWRSGTVPRWVAVTVIAYEPLNIIGGDNDPLGLVAAVVLLAAFAGCAAAVVRDGLPALAATARPATTTSVATTSPVL